MNQSLLLFSLFGPFFWLIRQVSQQSEYRDELVQYLCGGLLLSTIFGLYQAFHIGISQLSVGVNGTQIHSSFFGETVMMGIFLALFLGFSKKPIWFGATLLFVLGVLVSLSRASWLATIIPIFVILFWQRSNWSNVANLRTRLLSILIGVVSIGILWQPVSTRLGSFLETAPTTSHHIRLLELQGAFRMLTHTSLVGVGPGQLPLFYPQFRVQEVNQTQEWQFYPRQIRNNLFDFWLTFGIWEG
jgi:hypothetical protein